MKFTLLLGTFTQIKEIDTMLTKAFSKLVLNSKHLQVQRPIISSNTRTKFNAKLIYECVYAHIDNWSSLV